MRQPSGFFLSLALALILAQSFASIGTEAKERRLRAPPLIEKASQKCLVDYILREHENQNVPSSDILTIEQAHETEDKYYITDYLTNSLNKDFLQQTIDQKLQAGCQHFSKTTEENVDSALLGKIGTWPANKDIVTTDRCSIGKAYQKGEIVIVSYSCNPIEHRSLTPDRSKWCSGLLDASGSIAVFKQKSGRLTLEGIGETDDADMAFKCSEEKDPRQ